MDGRGAADVHGYILHGPGRGAWAQQADADSTLSSTPEAGSEAGGSADDPFLRSPTSGHDRQHGHAGARCDVAASRQSGLPVVKRSACFRIAGDL